MGGLVLVSFGVEARWWVPRGWPGWQVLVFVPAGGWGLGAGFLVGGPGGCGSWVCSGWCLLSGVIL
jgi:hypothetical protein